MTNAPSAKFVETEERAVEPVRRALLTTLDHCARAEPTLRTEIAIYAAIDVAVVCRLHPGSYGRSARTSSPRCASSPIGSSTASRMNPCRRSSSANCATSYAPAGRRQQTRAVND